jgi:hypothetical protein
MKIVEIKTVDECCNGYVDYNVQAKDVDNIDGATPTLNEMVQAQLDKHEITIPPVADGKEYSIDGEDEVDEENMLRVDRPEQTSATEPVAVLNISESNTSVKWFLVD